MFSILFIVIIFLGSVGMFLRGLLSNYGRFAGWSTAGDFSMAIVFLIGCVSWIMVDYYIHRIYMPQAVIYYRQMVMETKELVKGNSKLNMKDMQMGRELTERISDERDFQAKIRIAIRSPFVIFKPDKTLQDD